MKTFKLTNLALIAIPLVVVITLAFGQGPKRAASVEQDLIALDKQWGEAGGKGDTATLNKILGDKYVGIGDKGEALGKQEQVAATTATSANVQNASYTADEYKFETLSPDVIVMTHRATIKGMQGGKELTESHRSLHVFQKRGGQWQVVASTQVPIKE
jgi:hypothetical protein